jgi:hypothetical protein
MESMNGQLHVPVALASAAHWIGGYVGPTFGLEFVEKRNILHWRESNQGLPAQSPTLYRLSYSDMSKLN